MQKSNARVRLQPSSAEVFLVREGEQLTIKDPNGKQVADLVAFAADDVRERLDAGRTIDYERTLRLTTGNTLYSNRSRRLLQIVADDVGRHDILFAPCSREMFLREYNIEDHANCVDQLSAKLRPFGLGIDDIPQPFNIFMNVEIDGPTGRLTIRTPLSEPGSRISFVACHDILVAISACSAEKCNANRLGPIDVALTKGAVFPETMPDAKHEELT